MNGRRGPLPLRYLERAATAAVVAGKVDTEMSETEGPPQSLVVTLATLTVIGGFLDAVSYLGLGHVFTVNMTGNIVLIGFAAAGAPGFSVLANLCAVAFFVGGAAVGGRLDRLVGSHRTMLVGEMTLEGILIAAAAVVSACVAGIGTGWPRYLIIGLLSFAMGMRNASVRRMAVDGMTTTVLTTTLTGLVSDSALAGGSNPNEARRAISVLCMFAGALAGAALVLHVSPDWALGVAAVLALGAAAYFGRQEPLRLRPAQ
jgi:uncharacterized membrane protein YoaK (UPF0700 family)